MTKRSLRVAELDFDTIKNNLKRFLQSQTEFSDYDFEGSGLSVIIDLLSYNTHYNAVIANMLIQELYLDTAVKRQSLGLISKRLGYTPRGYRAAKATIDVSILMDSEITNIPDTAYIYKNTTFTAYVNDTTKLSFFTVDTHVATLNDGKYQFKNIDIIEGSPGVYRYTVTGNPQRFEIPSKNIDTLYTRVYVQTSNSSTQVEEWKERNSVIDVTSTDNVFFTKLNENLNYEIYFGDGIIGNKPSPGNIVIIEYISTNGIIGNNITDFTYANSIDNSVSIITNTVMASVGGNDPESNDDIRYNAQNSVFVQDRAITAGDYKHIISSLMSIDSINVYGGETLTPPAYGKVFICLKQSGSELPLSVSQKKTIINSLKKYSVLTLSHEIIDPEYINIAFNCKVRYKSDKTTLSADSLKSNVFNAIISYSNDIFNKFDSEFQYSRFAAYVDNIDPCIVSNLTYIQLHKGKLIQIDVKANYHFDFYTEIKPSTQKELNIRSSAFRIAKFPDHDVFITDNDGVLYMYRILNGQRDIIDYNIGTVNYYTGSLNFNLQIASSVTDDLEIYINPVEMNIKVEKNNILVVSPRDVIIQLEKL